MSQATIEAAPLEGAKNAVRVRVSGSIDDTAGLALTQRLGQLNQEGYIRFALDLSSVDYCGSAAFSAITDFHDDVESHGGEVVLVSPHEKVQRVIDMLGLIDLFQVTSTERDALRHLNGEDISSPSASGQSSGALAEVADMASQMSTRRMPAVDEGGSSDRPDRQGRARKASLQDF